MVLEPKQCWAISREMEKSNMEVYAQELVTFFKMHSLNPSSNITVPKYWAKTVLFGLRAMVEKFPNVKFSSVYESRNNLRISTIPDNARLTMLKLELCNKIDDVILDAVTALEQQTPQPFFLRKGL